MVERIVGYVAGAETTLNLGDGSFVDPELAQQWVDAILETGNFPYVGQGRFGHYQGLNDELIRRIESIVEGLRSEREDGGFSSDINVDIEGGSDVSVDWHDATVHLSLGTFLPNHLFEDREMAERVEARSLQDQALVSYRLADHMVETVKKLEALKQAQAAETQARHTVAALKATV